MTAKDILSDLEKLSFENTFNPYFERCPVHDLLDAPELRRYYLNEMLERAACTDLDAIWIGRDLGYKGGRRTGLALTDEIHFPDHLARWGLLPKRLTCGNSVSERTATVIWDLLLQIESPVFLWNVFPIHPYEEGKPFSNRAHNSKERKAGTEILIKVIHYLKPRRIIAVGNDAFHVLSSEFNSDWTHKVRHPSYGGQSDFEKEMRFLYKNHLSSRNLDLFDF